ncbi:stage V sporulation protein B [Pseudogracilibacillus auburnensis]|uniref:Stage V sporulation protein B n=1 Tax=Pseudogracilibacillus auburnensis TaxID=1494959 RepID=A0A2V3W0J6_9BACI|nr:stage V sporulation protein B [Pseudogracilibacillus auburnensis]MBO1003415.1 stage V sporulation protein B [Pseudogracilibacillus auburnensis]PXW86598.1 stage V sporulation protein B [Pseudogracilibacillus auburnensis]
MTKQSFIRGTMMLIIAGMITRLLGFVNRIVVARLMGEEGVGLYMMALPSLFLIITLTQIGLPISISKRVAEANAKNDMFKIKQIISLSFLIIACTSIFFTTCMIILAPFVANYLLTDSRTLYPLLAVSPVVPIIAITSVIKGYFQGMQNMKPQSYAIVIEQIVRISAVFILVSLLLPYGVEFAATGAMISVIIGEIASLAYLFFSFKRKKIVKVRHQFFAFLKGSKKTRQELFSIALPNTGSKLISSFAGFLEPILVAQSLAIAGVATREATKQYGELTGYAMPLLFLPTFITNSLSIALVPSIAESEAHGDERLVHYRIHQAIRISFASGALATIIFSLFSIPILTYMYDTSNASKYIILMAPFFLLLYIQAPLQSALFALDLAKEAMWNSLIGSVVKFITLFLLASNDQIGIMGVAIAISTSVVLITLLHLGALYKAIQFTLQLKDVVKMITLLVSTYLFGFMLKTLFANSVDQIVSFMLILIILTVIYIILVILLRFITKEELKQIPIVKNFL